MAKYDPNEFFDRKKPTNADRIRNAKDDEELRAILAEALRTCFGQGTEHCDGSCPYCLEVWLKEEANNG